MNSHGLFAYNATTGVTFSVTLRTEDGKGSGYISRGYNDASHLDIGNATTIAGTKAMASVSAKAIEPGKIYCYTGSLRLARVCLKTLMRSFDARDA